MNNISHVYIHIPFCKYICSYCDFCKKYIKHQNVDMYLDNLDKEIGLYIDSPIKVDTLYIGGGTPSALNNKQLDKLNAIIKKYFIFNKDYEFTFECNPDDINASFVDKIEELGVNRVSIGVQTLNNSILSSINRQHSKEDVQNTLNIMSNKISNISIDLMYNLPNQTYEDIIESIAFIKDNKKYIKHISYYGLILEDNTFLINDYNKSFIDEYTEEKWYNKIVDELNNIGFKQYEISNFADTNYQTKHNLNVWFNNNYYGFGLGASGYLLNKRYTNTSSISDYYNNILTDNKPIAFEEELSSDDINNEAIMLGLRTVYGINSKLINSVDDRLEIIEDNIRIKPKNFFISNLIIGDLFNK